MANERTFTLVGNFQDNITPKLTKLNTSISQLNKSFAKMQKMVRPIAKDMAIMAEASTRISDSFKGQRNAFDSSVRSMRQYRSEMGKVVAAQKKLERSVRMPSVRGGGAGGGGGGGRGGGGRRGGGVVGDVISGGLITEAIVRGFEMGAQIIQRAFSYISQAFAERVGDQLSDIASAGGIFASAKNAGLKGFGATMDDAMDVQKDLNRSMSKLAADLPGSTNDYVRNARSITDTIMTALAKSPKAFVGEMEKMTGKKGMDERGAVAAATQGVAKSTTLLEKLSPGGGIPMTMLFEDIMGREKVDAKSMQRKYASMRRNPTLVAALERNQEAINKTTAGTAERLAAINKALQEAVPPEMVNMMQRSVSGVTELFKSGFLDPDTGILGLSRQMGFMVKQFNTTTGELRRDKSGKVIEESVGIFEMISDIIGNLGVVLGNSILPALQSIVMPFDELGLSLVEFREYTFKLFEQFQGATVFFKDMAKSYGLDAGDFKSTTRAGLSVVANIFRSFGEIGEGKYQDIVKRLKSKDVGEVDKVGKELLTIFGSSKFVDTIAETIGKVIGGMLDSLADVMEMAMKGSDKFVAKGFGKGFQEAGGFAALSRIIAAGFQLIWKGFTEALKIWFASMGENLKTGNIGALIGQIGLTALLTRPLHGFLGRLFGILFSPKTAETAAKIGGVKSFLGRQAANTAKMGAAIPGGKMLAGAAKGAKMKGIGMIAAGMVTFATKAPALAKAGKAVMSLGKNIPLLSVAFAGLDYATRTAGGESKTTAAGGAVGGLIGGGLGATIGTAIAPGIGTAIGGVLGTAIGDWIGTNLPAFFASLPAKLDAAWASFKQWFADLPMNIGYAIGQARANLEMAWGNFSKWWQSLGPKFDQMVNNLVKGAQNFLAKAAAVLSNPGSWGDLAMKLLSGIKNAIMGGLGAVGNWFSGFGRGQEAGYRETRGGYTSTATRQRQAGGAPLPSIFARYKGGLGDALASEIKNKPSGSHLVIANSSETVIPAAGGYGMKEFMGVLESGFSMVSRQTQAIAQGVNVADEQSKQRDTKLAGDFERYQSESNQKFTAINGNISKLTAKVSEMSSMGGLMGGGGAGMALGSGYGGAGVKIAGALGNYIKATGGAPGSIHEHPMHGGVRGRHAAGSYHYSGRAIDIGAYANEQAGVIARIKAFNAKHGVRPVEFLHAGNDPKGHGDHVHVAYALGSGNPAFFNSKQAAQRWESKATMGNVKVSSITGNSGEGFGGRVVNVGGVHITQQPGQNAEQLAAMVIDELNWAIQQARPATMFV